MKTLSAGRPSIKKQSLNIDDLKEDYTIRLSLSIEKSLHKRIKQRSLDEDITIKDLIINILEKEFKK